MNGRIWSWIIAVPRFLYNFVVGDDWTVAVAILAGLIVTGILNANHSPWPIGLQRRPIPHALVVEVSELLVRVAINPKGLVIVAAPLARLA